MARTVCLDCGAICNGTRCPDCANRKDRRKQTARGDRYGQEHRALRRHWLPIVRAGGVLCSRCQQPIPPDADWALDHRPWGSEPSHPKCNNEAGGRAEP